MENSKFSLKNFRVFGDKGAEFEIAPITVLTGCNSSGKSSVIKSLMLLNNFANRIKEDYVNNKKIELNEYELLFNKGKHNLGSFQKTLSKHTKSKKRENAMTFSWTKYSHLIFGNITMEFTFSENHMNIFNNAIVEKMTISFKGSKIVELNFIDEFNFKIDFSFFKKYFFQFSGAVKHYNSIVDWLGVNEDQGVPNMFRDEAELLKNKENGLCIEAIESYIYIEKNLINRDAINSLTNKCSEIPEEAIKYKTLLYLPILDWLYDTPKSDVSKIILGKIEETGNRLDARILKGITDIISDFELSPFNSFIDFYVEVIESELINCFSTKKLGQDNKEYNKNWLINNIGWQLAYSKTKGSKDALNKFKKTLISSSITDFLSEIQQYISIQFSNKHNFDFRYWLSLNQNEPSKMHEHFMCLAMLCLNIDREFVEKRYIQEVHEPYDENANYYDAKEYNSATNFILAFIQDAFYNLPSYIENINFVEAVRTNVQRIYAFNQSSDFNELLLTYLNTTNTTTSKKEKKDTTSMTIRVGEENGNQIFELIEKENNEHEETSPTIEEGYKLGTFMKKWLKEFDIADDVIFKNTTEGLGVLIYVEKNGKTELLADQGYGITQFLAILLKIETVILKSEFKYQHPLIFRSSIQYHKSTISIEEPETNLHPKFQSLLAEMFMDAYKTYNIRFIVETHSEYLIRKLQTLVAKKEITPNDVALHYIYDHDPKKRPAGKPQVLKIDIKEDGRLSDSFGTGFFDEADNLAMDLLTLKSLN